MKIKKKVFLILFLFFSCNIILSQNNVIISDVNNTTPDASSVLEIRSTSKGLLIPRVSLSSMNDAATITLPATSLLVYNTNSSMTNGAGVGYYYNAGTAAAPNWQKFLASNTVDDWKLLGNSGTSPSTNFLGTIDNQSLVFRTSNTERIRILNTGNVGIGVTTPDKLLHIGAGNGDGLLIGSYNSQLGWSGSGTAPELSIRFAGFRDVVSNFSGAKIAAIRTNLCCSGLSQGTELAFSTQEVTATGAGDANLVERVRIGNGGNVGIGTSAPNDKLDVLPTNGKNMLVGGGSSTGSEVKFTNAGTAHFSLYNSGNSNLTFANTSSAFQTNTAGTALMSLTSAGNLGIGTTSPSEKLQVNGNAQIDGALRGTVRYYAEAGNISALNGNNRTTDGWYWNGASGSYSISDLVSITVPAGTYIVYVTIKADDNNGSDRVHCGLRRSDTGFIYDWVSGTRDDDRWTSFTAIITLSGTTSLQAAMNADDDFYLDYSSIVAIRLN